MLGYARPAWVGGSGLGAGAGAGGSGEPQEWLIPSDNGFSSITSDSEAQQSTARPGLPAHHSPHGRNLSASENAVIVT